MHDLGKFLVIVGLVIAGVGLLLWTGFDKGWFGRLPGDIRVEKGNFRFYFPLTTMIILSIVISILIRIFRKF